MKSESRIQCASDVVSLASTYQIPIPSRDTESLDLELISRRYESTSTRPDTKDDRLGEVDRDFGRDEVLD
jgi:hypothetical protein